MGPIEGVTVSVSDKMNAVHATVLREDGLLLRTCEHGVRHPVGNIHTGEVTMTNTEKDHEIAVKVGPHPATRRVSCCADACCQSWV